MILTTTKGSFITTAEFRNEEACRYAGGSAEVLVRNDAKYHASTYSFTCMPKGN